ncbi:MAG: ATP-binding cassette domain-containing protein [Lactobacillus sp.]|nr:ATP-binding cassette domain-containing protein [Lactobacillus sp.]
MEYSTERQGVSRHQARCYFHANFNEQLSYICRFRYITGLRKNFNNVESLTYPDIHIKAGEKILLSGDSGTGKSTLFKLILQELMSTTGEITFRDKEGRIIEPNLN